MNERQEISLATITDSDGNVYYKNDAIAQTNTTVPQKEEIITPDFMNSMISAITLLEGTVDKIDNCGYDAVCCQSECIINECIEKIIECNYCLPYPENEAASSGESSDDNNG